LRRDYPDLNIQVDGGINDETVKVAAEAGANIFVAGSYIFGSKDPGKTITYMRDEASKYLKN
jgi:ribulose-phosphate 3-epimerase